MYCNDHKNHSIYYITEIVKDLNALYFYKIAMMQIPTMQKKPFLFACNKNRNFGKCLCKGANKSSPELKPSMSDSAEGAGCSARGRSRFLSMDREVGL